MMTLAGRVGALSIRVVDDWLFILPSLAVAEQLMARLMRGFPDFGCHIKINTEKTKVSFHVPSQPQLAPSLYRCASGRAFIPWCGLLIEYRTLQVQADYTRYSGLHLRESANLPRSRHPGRQLGAKLCGYLKPRLIPVLYDPAINPPTTLRINAYQAFLFLARRFHCYLDGLGPGLCLSLGVQVGAIRTAVVFFQAQIKAQLVRSLGKMAVAQGAGAGGGGGGGAGGGGEKMNGNVGALSRIHVLWLALHAFLVTLERKHSVHTELLAHLKKEIQGDKLKYVGLQSDMQAAVHQKYHTMFRDIKY